MINDTGDDFDALPPPDQLKAEALNNEEYDNDDGHDVVDEFPAPPPPEHLAKLSMEAQLRVSTICQSLVHSHVVSPLRNNYEQLILLYMQKKIYNSIVSWPYIQF